VSNPPYIAETDRESLAPEVADWEPASALFAGPGGLSVLDAIVAGGSARLNPGGLLAVEVGLGQAEWVMRRAREHGGYTAVRVARDLGGRDRVVLAERS
jgi:release factor glutamine methyltransferase